MHAPITGGDGSSEDIIAKIEGLLFERHEDPPSPLVITVEGARFSGKTTILDKIAARYTGTKVHVRPRRDKISREGTCLLLGAKAFTQESEKPERYAEFRRVVERASAGYRSGHLHDAAATTDFLALVEDMLGQDTVYVLLDDFESFDDLSKDLYSQMIGLISRMDCVVIATSSSASVLSLISTTHRMRIDSMSLDSIITDVEALTGIAPPPSVAKQLSRMADATRGIVRETALALSPSQLTGASHISHTLCPGPLALEKAEPAIHDLPENVAAALSAIAHLDVVSLPFARVIADLAGTDMQDLVATGCLRFGGGRVKIHSGVVQRSLALIFPQVDASDSRWRAIHRPASGPSCLSGTESVHISLHFAASSLIDTERITGTAATASAQGGADSARLLVLHAWNALPLPDAEVLMDTDLCIASEDGRFADVLESTDALLRDLPTGERRMRVIAKRLDAAHALYEHSSFASAIEEYQRHRAEYPESSLRHLLESAERSFDLELRHEGLQLLAEASDLLDEASSPAVKAEFELLRAWQIDRVDPDRLTEIIDTWWQANHYSGVSLSTRLLQVLAAADPAVARYLSRDSAIRPVSRSRRMGSLLVGAEADLDGALLESASRQLDALDALAHSSAFHPLRRAIARLTVNMLRSASHAGSEKSLDGVAELRSILGGLRGESPALAARGWMTIACCYALAGQEDLATDAIANAWRVSRPVVSSGGGQALLLVVLPIVRSVRAAARDGVSRPPHLDPALRSAIAKLDPAIDIHDLSSAVRELTNSPSLTHGEKLMLSALTQRTPPVAEPVLPQGLVLSDATATPSRKPFATLSSREREVALRAIRGERNREIGAQMFLSLRTVEATLTQIYRKLNVRSRLELAAMIREDQPPRSGEPALTTLR